MPAAHEAQINLELGFIGPEIVWPSVTLQPTPVKLAMDTARLLDVAIDSHLQQQVLAISSQLLT